MRRRDVTHHTSDWHWTDCGLPLDGLGISWTNSPQGPDCPACLARLTPNVGHGVASSA